jgi:hypothetical protein
MTVEIKEILDLITNMNINRCAYTTYDLGVQECSRQEIIKGLALHYGITYQIAPANVTTFPVKSTSA